MSHKIEIEQTGRGGTVKYLESDGELSFDWEFTSDGADIFVPTASQWDLNCRSNNATWAEGRRQEILERVAEEVRARQAPNSVVTVEDCWIHFEF